MSTDANGEVKPKLSPRDVAMIAGAIVALIIAIVVIGKTVNANRVHDVIVIKGATGAKPMGNTAAQSGKNAGDSASDQPLKSQ